MVSKFPHFFRDFPTLSISKTARTAIPDVVLPCEVIHVSQSRKEFEGKEVPLWKWFGRRWIGPPTMLPRQQKSLQQSRDASKVDPRFALKGNVSWQKKQRWIGMKSTFDSFFLKDLVVVVLWHYVFFRCLLRIGLLRGGLVHDLISWRIGWTKRVFIGGYQGTVNVDSKCVS